MKWRILVHSQWWMIRAPCIISALISFASTNVVWSIYQSWQQSMGFRWATLHPGKINLHWNEYRENAFWEIIILANAVSSWPFTSVTKEWVFLKKGLCNLQSYIKHYHCLSASNVSLHKTSQPPHTHTKVQIFSFFYFTSWPVFPPSSPPISPSFPSISHLHHDFCSENGGRLVDSVQTKYFYSFLYEIS